jgi:hypothetical protein
LTPGSAGGTLASMASHRPDDDPSEDLPPAEAARARRRDHDSAAAARSGMRTGVATQFKQVLDAEAKRARAARPRPAAQAPTDEPSSDPPPEPPPKKRGHRAHRPAEPR